MSIFKTLGINLKTPGPVCVAPMSIFEATDLRSKTLALDLKVPSLVCVVSMSIFEAICLRSKTLALDLKVPSLVCVALMSIFEVTGFGTVTLGAWSTGRGEAIALTAGWIAIRARPA
jgi:hypothetical protein